MAGGQSSQPNGGARVSMTVTKGEAFIIKAPEDANQKVWQATAKLQALTAEIVDAYGRRDWARGDELTSQLAQSKAEMNMASTVVQHGDLNVVELLLKELRDGEWHNMWGLESKLASWDWRLGQASVQDPTEERSDERLVSPVRALIYLWRQPGGRLKEHGGRMAFRLKKPGEV